MIQIFKIFHGIDMMEIDNNYSFQHREVTVFNIMEKFRGTPIGQIISLIDQRTYGIPSQNK